MVSMATIKIIKSFLKKQKIYALSIFILTLIISASFLSICSVLIEGNQHFDTINANSFSPDYINWLNPSDYSLEKINDIKNNRYVDHIEEREFITFFSRTTTISIFINDQLTKHTIPFQPYQPTKHPYAMLEGDSNHIPSIGNVFIPYIYKDLYNCKIGDSIKIQYLNQEYTYKIEDFYEHPYSSSSLLGFKNILVNDEDYHTMKTKDPSIILNFTNLYTYFKDDALISKDEIIHTLNTSTDIENYGDFAYSLAFFKEGSLTLLQITSTILLIFIAILFAIVLLVINYAIKSSIQRDYATFGVLKALGMQANQILRIVVSHYILIASLGILCGILCSFQVVGFVGDTLMNGTGFLYQPHINITVLFISAFSLLTFIIMICILSAWKVRKISPMQAINKGRAPVYFFSQLNISIDKLSFLPLYLRLSIKQVISNLTQYISVIFMSIFLIFSMITVTNVKQEFSETNILKLVGIQDSDLAVYMPVYDAQKIKEIRNVITQETTIEDEFMQGNIYLTIDDVRVLSSSINNYETSVIKPIEGRWPKYKNEVSITKVVANTIQKELGDSVRIRYKNGEEKEYIICGYHQAMNELGKYIYLSKDGIQQLESNYQESYINFQIKDKDKINILINTLNTAFNDHPLEFINRKETTEFESDVIVRSIQQVAFGVNVLAIALVGIVVLLISSICIEKEKMELGIMRAQGFTTNQLRFMFTLRFTIIIFLSGCTSLLFNRIISDKLLSIVLTRAGVFHFESHLNFENTLLPILIITSFIFVFSYLNTRKIKHVNIINLINE